MVLDSDADAALEVVSDQLSSEDFRSDYDAKTGANLSEVRKCLAKEAVIDDDDDDAQLSKGLHVNTLLSSTDVSAADIVSPSSSISKSGTEGGTDSMSESDSITSAQPNDSMPTSSVTDIVEPAGGANSVSDIGENKLTEEDHSVLTIDKTGILSRDIINTPTAKDADGSRINNVTSGVIQVKAADLQLEKTENSVAPGDSNNNGDAVVRQDAKIVCIENVDKISNLHMREDITAVTDTDNGDKVTRVSCDMSNVSDGVANTIAPTDAPETADDMILESGSDESTTNDRDSEILTADKGDPDNKLQNRNVGNESENEAGELTKKQPDEHSDLENANRQNNETAGFVTESLESSEQATFSVAREMLDNSSSVDKLSPAKPSRDLRLVHPASVSVVSEPGEEMTKNIGSMNVEVTDELNIVDGLVQPAENLVKISRFH